MELLTRLFVPAAFIVFAAVFLASSWNLDFRSIAFPYLAIIIVAVLSFAAMLSEILTWRRKGTSIEERETDTGDDEPGRIARISQTHREPVLTFILLVAYVYFIRDLGFYVTTFIFLMLSSLIIGISWRRTPILIVLMAGITIASVFLFEVFLQIPLP